MNALSEYRRNAIEGKSGIGLVVVLYDALVGALYKGALAIKQGDIESRTKNLNQAIRIAGHLQRSEEHTSELQSRQYLVCRLLLEKKNETNTHYFNWPNVLTMR